MSTIKIFLRDFKTEAFIGIYEHEKKNKNPVTIDVECELVAAAVERDHIESTFNYERIIEKVREMTSIHHDLVEKFASDLCDFCLQHPQIQSTQVTIQKTKAFAEGPVGATVTKSR